MAQKKNAQHAQSKVIHTRAAADIPGQVSSIHMTSGFMLESAEQARALFAGEIEGYLYTRWSNPNTDEFIHKLCLLEAAEAGLPVASGMAAIFTILAGLLNSGDHVLAARSLFASTHQILTRLLPRWGISHTYADITTPESWAALFQPTTRLCLVETPTNPSLDLVDLAWLADLCHAHDVVLVVDNVFATPILQQPVKLGADLVVHSATKFIDGQGRGIGGAIVGDRFLIEELVSFYRHTGPTMSPFNAWLFSQGLELLPLRMAKHSENALALAQWLEAHPAVASVRYPYLPSHPQYELAQRQMSAGGGMVTFILKGGVEAGRCFLDTVNMATHVTNLGDVRTIVTHPASTTHSGLSEEERQSVGILPGLVRVSVGLEHIDDIIADFAQALDR
jgi:O-succinylhomoserine sulfhydrylase